MKRKEEATEFYHIAKEAEEGVRIIKQVQDPSDVYKYTQKGCIAEIKKLLAKNKLDLYWRGEIVTFNRHHFQLLISYFSIKENGTLCFKHRVPKIAYTYSYQAIEFIFRELQKDPKNILDKIKHSLKRKES